MTFEGFRETIKLQQIALPATDRCRVTISVIQVPFDSLFVERVQALQHFAIALTAMTVAGARLDTHSSSPLRSEKPRLNCEFRLYL